MRQQEFYIKLLQEKVPVISFEEIPPEFFKNYEFAKLVLGKFGIEQLSEAQQKNFHIKAIGEWLSVSKYISLQYNTPEIVELIPEEINGTLDLRRSKIEALPNLRIVRNHSDLENSLNVLEIGKDIQEKRSALFNSLEKLNLELNSELKVPGVC